MKRLSLLFISLLSLCACNTQSKDKNTSVVQEKKYTYVNAYSNVSYYFDKYMRCVVHYDHYKGDDESGYVLDYSKDWCVYLTGYYYSQYIDSYSNAFYECKLNNANKYDYYLLYRGN